jgi:hypothetical protein
MALKIIKSTDAIKVERINLCIYGPPGIGKTSVAFTAESPLLLDFDNGAHRAANRQDTVRVQSWGDVAEFSADDLESYKTVVVDTAGRALDILTQDIIRRNPKAGRGGALTLQGYGTLKAEFVAWLKMINGFGKDVILVAHMDEQRNGDDIIERLDVQGGSKGEIYKAADAMGRMSIRDGRRTLNFSPTDAAFGKNPGQLEPLSIPHPDKSPQFLAGVIGEIKGKLNSLTEDQAKAQKEIADWVALIADLVTPDDFNSHLEAVKKSTKAVQTLFNTAAQNLDFEYDKTMKGYREKVAA